jgi:hypothetical protein
MNKGYTAKIKSVVKRAERIINNAAKPQNNKKQQPKRNRNRNRKNQKGKGNKGKNQVRSITDVPLGTSQRQGFNRNSQFKIVTKDEYIGDVAGTVAFTTTQYAVNPGQKATFPWLAPEALQWEKYEFLKLRFYLKPEVTQYTTNANSGKVILSFDSDASDPPPLNKQEAEDVMPMADGMSYQQVDLNIPKFILNSHLDSFYVRPGNLPGGSDIKTYDLGNLFVSTIGQGGAVPNMMELRVEYTCKLMIPILENTAAAPQNNQVTNLVDSKAALTTTVAYQPLLATVASTALAVTNGLNVVNTAGSIVPPPGNYLLDVDVNAQVTNGTDALNGLYLQVMKNTVVQNPGGLTAGNYTGLVSNVAGIEGILFSSNLYISCNGTDAITISVIANFTSPTTCTTSFRLASV